MDCVFAVFAFSFFPVSVLGVFAFSRFRVPQAAPLRPGHTFRVHSMGHFAFSDVKLLNKVEVIKRIYPP